MTAILALGQGFWSVLHARQPTVPLPTTIKSYSFCRADMTLWERTFSNCKEVGRSSLWTMSASSLSSCWGEETIRSHRDSELDRERLVKRSKTLGTLNISPWRTKFIIQRRCRSCLHFSMFTVPIRLIANDLCCPTGMRRQQRLPSSNWQGQEVSSTKRWFNSRDFWGGRWYNLFVEYY